MTIRRRTVWSGVLAFAVIGLFAMVWAQTSKPADLTGTWKWTSEGPGGQQETTLTLKQDGEKLTGTITGFQGESPISEGTVKDGNVSFKVVMDMFGRQMVTQYTAKFSGDSLKGKVEIIIANDFDGKRAK